MQRLGGGPGVSVRIESGLQWWAGAVPGQRLASLGVERAWELAMRLPQGKSEGFQESGV